MAAQVSMAPAGQARLFRGRPPARKPASRISGACQVLIPSQEQRETPWRASVSPLLRPPRAAPGIIVKGLCLIGAGIPLGKKCVFRSTRNLILYINEQRIQLTERRGKSLSSREILQRWSVLCKHLQLPCVSHYIPHRHVTPGRRTRGVSTFRGRGQRPGQRS